MGETGAGAFVFVAFGALAGMAAGVLAPAVRYVLTRDDPSFPETGCVQARRYDVRVDEAHADRADEVLRSSD